MKNQPQYWQSVPPNHQIFTVAAPEGYPKAATGNFIVMLKDLADWYGNMYSETNSVDEATSGTIGDIVSNAIDASGKMGFLFEMRVHTNQAGFSTVIGKGLIEVGPGNDPIDAIADNLRRGPSISINPEAGAGGYDNSRSYFVFVKKNKSGELSGSIIRYPLHAYAMARKQVFAELNSDKFASQTASRALTYSQLSNAAYKVAKSENSAIAIQALQIARDNAASETLSAFKKLQQAKQLQASADRWTTFSQVFGLGASGMELLNKTINVEGASSELTGRLEIQIRIEQNLNIELKKVIPNGTTPPPLEIGNPL